MEHRCRGALVSAGLIIIVWAAPSTPARAQSPGAPPAPVACRIPSGAPPRPAIADPGWPDWLLRQNRYPELAAWVTAQHHQPTASAGDLAYFRGVLANRQNRSAESIRLLGPVSSRLDPVADSARIRVVLETLADDYTKTYQYGAAAGAFERLERLRAASMTEREREDVRNGLAIRTLLRGAPAQRVLDARPFAVPLRRDSLGLMEVPVRVGPDSAWWILDTGANFSTLTKSTARRLGLTVSRGTAKVKGMTGAYSPLHVAIVPEVRIGTARVRNVAVLVLADSDLFIPQMPFQITAILGYPVLEALDRIAVGTNQLQVTPDPQGAPSDSSNLFLDDLQPLIAVTVDDSTALYHFDSGADASILGVHFCRAYPQRMAGLASHDTEFGGAGGSHKYGAYTLARLPMSVRGTIATLDSVSVLKDSTTAAFEPYYGNLGQDLVAAFGGFTIDFRAMTFHLGTSVP
jgi:predicted aspartyl protease